MGKRQKKPKASFEPSIKKRPKAASNPSDAKVPRIPHMPDVRGGPLMWRFSGADRNGDFAWSSLDDPASYKRVLEKLHEFETMTERDIGLAGCHAVDVSGCCDQAKSRLQEIELDDLDQLYSFRITGAERVWCRTLGNLMLVLWWDPEHRVYPSKLKHT